MTMPMRIPKFMVKRNIGVIEAPFYFPDFAGYNFFHFSQTQDDQEDLFRKHGGHQEGRKNGKKKASQKHPTISSKKNKQKWERRGLNL